MTPRALREIDTAIAGKKSFIHVYEPKPDLSLEELLDSECPDYLRYKVSSQESRVRSQESVNSVSSE